MRTFRFLRGDIGQWWSRIFPGAPMTTPPDTPNEVLDVVQPVQDIFGSALHQRRSLYVWDGVAGAATAGFPASSPTFPVGSLAGKYAEMAIVVPADEIWIVDKLFSFHSDAATKWGLWYQRPRLASAWSPLTGRTAMGANEVYCPVGLHTVIPSGGNIGMLWEAMGASVMTFGFQYVPLKVGETLNPTAV